MKKQQLMDLYDQQEAEASTLSNMLLMNIELYNRKLSSLEMTRDLIEGMTGPDEFYDCDGKYEGRMHMRLDTVQQLVSIYIYFKILLSI